jgi:hypothetical protein
VGNETAIITEDHNTDVYDPGENPGDFDTMAFSTWLGTNRVTVTFTGTDAGSYSYLGGATGTFTGAEQITGTSYADTMNAGAETDGVLVFGNVGDDSIIGGSGNDSLHGDAGNDQVFGGGGDDQLFGGTEADSLFGGTGNDMQDGGMGAGSVDGGAGNDVIPLTGAESANDVAFGGDGKDTLTSRVDPDGDDFDTRLIIRRCHLLARPSR